LAFIHIARMQCKVEKISRAARASAAIEHINMICGMLRDD